LHPRPKVFKLFNLLDDGEAFLLLITLRCFSVCGFLVVIGKVPVCLRCRSLASSVRSTLLGEAGWHRANFAETRTLDVGAETSGRGSNRQEATTAALFARLTVTRLTGRSSQPDTTAAIVRNEQLSGTSRLIHQVFQLCPLTRNQKLHRRAI